MAKTAAELISELKKSEVYQAKKQAQGRQFSNLEEMYAIDQKQLVKELNQAGFPVRSVWDFVNAENDYAGAVPILIKHLKIKHHFKILAGIARSLAIAELSNNDELWNLLVDLYSKTPSNAAIKIAEERGAQEAIAVALESLAIESRVDSLKKLIDKNPEGDGIDWLQDKLKTFNQINSHCKGVD